MNYGKYANEVTNFDFGEINALYKLANGIGIAYFLYTFFFKFTPGLMNFLSKEYQAWLHWSPSLPALLSKRISQIIGKVKKNVIFATENLGNLGLQIKNGKKAATNFSKYSCTILLCGS